MSRLAATRSAIALRNRFPVSVQAKLEGDGVEEAAAAAQSIGAQESVAVDMSTRCTHRRHAPVRLNWLTKSCLRVPESRYERLEQ